MSNPKRHQIIKLSLVALAAISLVYLSHGEYQGKPFRQTKDLLSYLVDVIVLVDLLSFNR